jgi:hypothetical protein
VASGLYRFVAGARPVASDWNDYIAKQEMMVYASEAARDSDLATDKREGMFAYLSDKNWTTYYNGANWLLIAGRLGVVATGSTQSIPNNVATAASFDAATNVNDTFITPTGTTFTIPTSSSTTRGGRYTIIARAGLTSATSGTLEIQVAGKSYDYGFNTSASPAASVPGLEVASGSVCQLVIKQTLGSAQNCSFEMQIWYEAPSS